MRRMLLKTVVASGLTLFVASGCTSTHAGTPTASPTMSTPTGRPDSSSPNDDFGAPRVATPIDGTRLFATPCAVLTPAQLQSLNLPAGEPDTTGATAKAAGSGCTWTNSDTPSTVGFGFMSGNKNGLSDTYSIRDRFVGYFEPTEVEGYPAVYNSSVDGRPRGICVMTTGISDTLTFIASETGRLGVKSCDRAKQVASMVVQTIKAGG